MSATCGGPDRPSAFRSAFRFRAPEARCRGSPAFLGLADFFVVLDSFFLIVVSCPLEGRLRAGRRGVGPPSTASFGVQRADAIV
ncbi:MAG TPA: hypothetical protein VMN39_11705 [Longimicrobiaceae bacterium]|nr:hypothetical protein [Longimicrobiaceae bacterium]